jgi:hypothetical protein
MRSFDPKSAGENLEQQVRATSIELLEAVDHREAAGTGDMRWEDAFRGFVTSLDRHFDMMRRTYDAHGQDNAAITKRYDKCWVSFMITPSPERSASRRRRRKVDRRQLRHELRCHDSGLPASGKVRRIRG